MSFSTEDTLEGAGLVFAPYIQNSVVTFYIDGDDAVITTGVPKGGAMRLVGNGTITGYYMDNAQTNLTGSVVIQPRLNETNVMPSEKPTITNGTGTQVTLVTPINYVDGDFISLNVLSCSTFTFLYLQFTGIKT